MFCEDEIAGFAGSAAGGVADGFPFVGIAVLLEVEILKNLIFFFVGDFGFDFYGGVFFTFGVFIADFAAVGVGEDGVAILGKLTLVAVIDTGGSNLGCVALLSEHDGYIDGIRFYLFDSSCRKREEKY